MSLRAVCRYLVIGLLSGSVVWWAGATASAHVLRQDGPAAAVMHIEPDDNPVAGQATVISFDFSPSDLGFTFNAADTHATLSHDGAVVADKPLLADNAHGGHATFIFPQQGVYDFTVRGGQAPQAYRLAYVVRVNRTIGGNNPAAGNAQTVALISVASLCLLALVARRLIIDGGRYASPHHKRKGNR